MTTATVLCDPKFARAVELLRAARDLIDKADEGPYVIDVMNTTVFYDGADCDGSCLRDDINHLLWEIEDAA